MDMQPVPNMIGQARGGYSNQVFASNQTCIINYMVAYFRACENESRFMSCEDKRGTHWQSWHWHGNVKQPWIAVHVQKHVPPWMVAQATATKRCEPCFAASCGPLSHWWAELTVPRALAAQQRLWAHCALCCEAQWPCWTPSATWTSSMRRMWQRTLSPKVVAFLDMVVSPRSWASTAGGWEPGWLVRRCYLKKNKRKWAP